MFSYKSITQLYNNLEKTIDDVVITRDRRLDVIHPYLQFFKREEVSIPGIKHGTRSCLRDILIATYTILDMDEDYYIDINDTFSMNFMFTILFLEELSKRNIIKINRLISSHAFFRNPGYDSKKTISFDANGVIDYNSRLQSEMRLNEISIANEAPDRSLVVDVFENPVEESYFLNYSIAPLGYGVLSPERSKAIIRFQIQPINDHGVIYEEPAPINKELFGNIFINTKKQSFRIGNDIKADEVPLVKYRYPRIIAFHSMQYTLDNISRGKDINLHPYYISLKNVKRIMEKIIKCPQFILDEV